MPAIEWVLLYSAAPRLEELWGIPPSIAEQIVRNVIQGGKVAVRGVPRGQLVYQIITAQICAALSPISLFAADYENVEIDWKGLVAQGRELLPQWIQVAEPRTRRKGSRYKSRRVPRVVAEAKLKERHGPEPTKSKIVDAAKRLIARNRTPTTCGTWEEFRRELCDELGLDKKSRGYQLDTVQSAVGPLLKSSTARRTKRAESTES
jgi:hypothetical protein